MGAYYLQSICRPCSNAIDKERQYIKKIAGPKPFFCQCCFKTTDDLQRDHIRGTYIFRGWACKGCNTGLGLFNDNLRGLLVGALYLEKDPQKIIEELNNIISRKEDQMRERKNKKRNPIVRQLHNWYQRVVKNKKLYNRKKKYEA
jgi:hypothetical protein